MNSFIKLGKVNDFLENILEFHSRDFPARPSSNISEKSSSPGGEMPLLLWIGVVSFDGPSKDVSLLSFFVMLS